ncbi:MAG: argininosuccinate lyase [Dehalococcoidia bacterium]|nr:argininosuccinate lyase [Dehalococcoidia bacterium]
MPDPKGRGKPWSGRFAKKTNPLVDAYTGSLDIDATLYSHDIRASIAHARMLARQRIIPRADANAIVRGLREIEREIERGEFPFDASLEDIHTNIESRLADKIGDAAGRLHTARSRNDQVATDLRLSTKDAIEHLMGAIYDLQSALLDMAERHSSVVMPGYTHLQRAQPVLLAHHLLAYFEMLERDFNRFAACYVRTNVLPLGSGALAGVPYPLDRASVAKELEFAAISRNSIDAVSDRDFVAEFLACAAICAMHLSRLAEEIVLWSTAEFGFMEIDDAFATGSSIMPQKKNPDVAELARGRTGRIYGNLVGFLTVLKALPLSYNRDLQEDKAPLFETYESLLLTLFVMAEMLPSIRVNEEVMRAAATAGYTLATDLADYQVRKGVPFREAHQAVGKLVRYASGRGKGLSELTLKEYQRHSPLFEEDVLGLDVEASLRARDVPGGTAPQRVAEALKEARRRLATEEGENGE